jgi:hypothetical protein
MCSREGKKRKKMVIKVLNLQISKVLNRIGQISIFGIQENGRMLNFFHFHILRKG